MPLLLLAFLILTHCSHTEKVESPKTETLEPVERKKIIKTIQSHRRYLSNCYGQALMGQGSAKLKGTVMVEFSIGPDGKAFSPKVVEEKSTLQNSTLNQCLFAGITSWDFPVHPKGMDLAIRYPFKFRDKPPAGMQKKMDQFEKMRRH